MESFHRTVLQSSRGNKHSTIRPSMQVEGADDVQRDEVVAGPGGALEFFTTNEEYPKQS